MSGNDYNVALSVFYVSYIVFEIPANVLCKYMGPGWFLPATSLGFGLVSIFTAFVKTSAQICGVRFVLGIFEAGMLPGIAYYMSRWYRRAELTYRLSLYIVMAPLAGAFGGLLASAILTLDKFGMFHSWQMIFGKLPPVLYIDLPNECADSNFRQLSRALSRSHWHSYPLVCRSSLSKRL